ncbi:DUF4920 domain-containing protein [Neolewinella persica]|uniref:DUF4920 domain-containing protein n=1 Tax=Neolewinella persica TaxID=70998 RepID=UPI00037A1C1A|nr:DUF4920 domain-containing protein [Neolewinella persica]
MKNFLNFLTVACFGLILSACAGSEQQAVEATAEAPTSETTEIAGTFGAEFTPTEVLAANKLLTTYEESLIVDTLQTTLRGTVNEVCQAKGCWMTIAASDDDEMMVKFKDYGFFMPMDISGREVIMHGMAYYQITPVDELRHYAEDAGKSEEEIAAITEPKRELRFLADGVQLLGEKM